MVHRRKTRQLNLRVTPEQLKLWRKAADKDRRPLSQWISIMLDEMAHEALGEK